MPSATASKIGNVAQVAHGRLVCPPRRRHHFAVLVPERGGFVVHSRWLRSCRIHGRVHVAPLQRLEQGLGGRGRRHGARQDLRTRHARAVKLFIQVVPRRDNLAIERDAGVQSLGQTVRVDGSRGVAAVQAPVSFQSPPQRSHRHAHVGAELHRGRVAEEQRHGGVRHQQKDVVRDLGTNQSAPRETRRADRARGAPPALRQARRHEARAEFDARQAETALDDRQDGHALGLFQEHGRYADAVQVAEIGGDGAALFFALLDFRVDRKVVVAVVRIVVVVLQHGPTALGLRQEIVERVGRLADLVSQRKGQRTVEEAARIGGVNVVEAHAVTVVAAELLLEGLQLGVAGAADAQGFAGQLKALLEALAVEELLLLLFGGGADITGACFD